MLRKLLGRLRGREARKDILIATIYFLQEIDGRGEVSLVEVMDAVKRLQEHLPLGYNFWDRFPYSPNLAEDLRSLEPLYVRRTIYHDEYIPKHYVGLSALGRSYANRALEKLEDNIKEMIKREATQAAKALKEAWTILGRPTLCQTSIHGSLASAHRVPEGHNSL